MSDDKQVTMHGNPLNLLGQVVAVGQAAPDAELLNNDLAPVKISGYKGKVVVLSVVPSLDTPTCDLQTRRFNSEAAGLGWRRGDPHHQHGSALCPEALVRARPGRMRWSPCPDHREAALCLAWPTAC